MTATVSDTSARSRKKPSNRRDGAQAPPPATPSSILDSPSVEAEQANRPGTRSALDEARIWIKAGDGGNGVVSFRREKFVPFGGPDGGDGGRGGSVYLQADRSASTLLQFSRKRHFKAEPGGHGKGQRKHGSAGDDLIIRVPPGTIVRSDDGISVDLLRPGESAMVARGGKGGLGNIHFATATHQAPRIAQKGEPGEERWLSLELKTIAQAALVGEPNAGKSSLLAATSEARPRIAAYPFTTLEPNLGVAEAPSPTGEGDLLVLADVPGLIAGAHTGTGLGHRFLRHVERAPVLVHVVDASRPDALQAYRTVRAELEAYKPEVGAKPEIVAANKLDLPGARDGLAALINALPNRLVIGTSAVTNEGIPDLLTALADLLATIPPPEAAQEPAPAVRVYRPAQHADESFTVERIADGVFRVKGKRVERTVAMTDLDNEDAIDHLQKLLKRMGVLEALERAGVQTNDTVHIGPWEMEWGI
jgi:GTP-binding protein